MDAVAPFAERVLFGTSFADKVAEWPDVDVRMTAPSRPLPSVPGRPTKLGLPTEHRKLPSIFKADLKTNEGRARVLHELMNHELQAIELLALALLRWPDAPAGFRRGLVATLRDEQRHCKLYVERLEAVGGSVGQAPVSRFFWDTLAQIAEPAAFMAGLSLCFEQANLDFCLEWKDRFEKAGDVETAAVLQVVHDDEIRHVAHGLRWFTKWSDGDRLDAWTSILSPPLSPRRARGRWFDRRGRSAAGFTDNEIERLRLVEGSRGRPPVVIGFDAGVEEAVSGQTRTKLSKSVTEALSSLPMFLVRSEDIVVGRRPSIPFLNQLQDAGFEVPRFVETLSVVHESPYPVARVVPWGACPDQMESSDTQQPTPAWNPTWRVLSSKVEWLRRLQGSLTPDERMAELGSIWTDVGEPPSGPWVIKRAFSTSGTGRIRGVGPLSQAHRVWVERRLATDGAVVVQPWLERLADVSIHVSIGDRVRLDGFTRFFTSGSGTYDGAVVGPFTQGMSSELLRALHEGRPSFRDRLSQTAEEAGRWASELGYRGPVSVDAMLVRGPTGITLHPGLELNARHTLGRVALAFGKRVAPRTTARWHVRGFDADMAARLTKAESPELRDGRLYRALLPTTDPQSNGLTTWLDVRPND